MAVATVIYHFDDPGWWAESPEFPEYSAFGDSLDEVRALAHEGLRFAADDDDLLVVDELTTIRTLTYAAPATKELKLSGAVGHARFPRDLALTA
jgi:predicted RNase H-like HicB family nuclease